MPYGKGTGEKADVMTPGAEEARTRIINRISPFAVVLLVASVASVLALSGCSGSSSAAVDEDSPRVENVSFVASNEGTETSQAISVNIEFDQEITLEGDVLGDLDITLNGDAVDDEAIAIETEASGSTLVISFVPSENAAAGPSGGSTYYAVYAGQVSISAKSSNGALASVVGESGSAAVLDEAITGTLPSGVEIEIISSTTGSEADNTLASVTFRVTSPALARCITWFSPDGGETLLLKHNHNFLTSDAEDCAADIASKVKAATELGLNASAKGDTVTITAKTVVDGQTIDPVIVEGVGVTGGVYDASEGTGE